MGRLEPVTPLNEDLILPIMGGDGQWRDYVLKPSTAEEWVRISAIRQTMVAGPLRASKRDSDSMPDSQMGFDELILGAETCAAMIADAIDGKDFQRAVKTGFQWRASGCDDEVAAAVWSGKSLSPDSTTLTGTDGDEASSTPTQTSGSGMSSPPDTSSPEPEPGSGSGPSGT